MRASGGKVPQAAKPHRILLKANINSRRRDEFLALGIREVKPDFQKREQKHVEDARRVGRQPYAVRENIADSGVAIFQDEEGNPGLKKVLVGNALDEILLDYRPTDLHIFQRRDRGQMFVLVITLEWGKTGSSQDIPVEVADFVANSSWEFCHIWANPQNADGDVVHTVNLGHRSDEAAECQLLFADGLWDITDAPAVDKDEAEQTAQQ
jgi:hypothetical protein